MNRFTIYTYKDLNEFNKFHTEILNRDEAIYDFKFQETRSLLEESNKLTIDITNLVLYLIQYPQDVYSALLNFEGLDKTSRIIIKESLAVHALEIFHLLFESSLPLYPEEKNEDSDNKLLDKIIPLRRHCLYTYNDDVIDEIIEYSNKQNIPIVNFTSLNNNMNEELNKYTGKESVHLFIDLTSVVLAIRDNSNLIYLIEQYLNVLERYNVIIKEDIADNALDLFKLTLSHSEKIQSLIPELILNNEHNDIAEKEEGKGNLVKITDLSVDEIELLLNEISSKLFGHQKFKDRFSETLKEFIFLNKIKEKKIFSVFLLGPTGVGKTEFARIIKNNLNESTSLAKINFGNFSSQDSLNSLIGSPRGYIGSEEGELSIKLQKSKVGIILCDEFEKASKPIYNFFLELLEDGVYTDSQSKEYNLDGYLIIFTSNLNEQGFYKIIPEEFQSRLDLVCEFDKLSNKEKQDYVKYFVNYFMRKLKSYDNQLFTNEDEDIYNIKNINAESVDNLRDIKRMIIKEIRKKIRK